MDLDKLLIKIEADLKAYDKALQTSAGRTAGLEAKVKKHAAGMQKAFDKAATKVARFGKYAALAAAATGAAMLKMGLDSGDALAKTADKLGLTTEGLAGLRFAAEQTGVASNKLDMGLQRMTRRVAEAAQGTGEAKNALKELGISAQEIARLSPDEQFLKIAGAMENVTSQSDKVRLGFKLFDSEGVALVNTLAAGEAGIRGMAAEADELGGALSRIDAAKIEMANDAMAKIKTAFGGAAQTIAAQFAPVLEAVSDKFTDIIKKNGAFKVEIVAAIKTGIVMVAKFADAWVGLEMIWEGLKLAWSGTALLITQGLADIDQAITDMANNANAAVNSIIEGANKLPGVEIELIADVEPNATLQQMAADAQAAFDNAESKFLKFTTAPLPSENVAVWLEEVEAAADEAAAKIAATKPGGADALDAGTLDPAEDPETIARKEALQQQIEALAEKLMTEEEMLNEATQRRLEMVMQAQVDDLVSAQKAAELRLGIEADFEAKMTALKKKGESEREKFGKKSWQGQVKQVAGSLMQMTQSMATSNKAMFRINQAAAIANAVVNTAQGVTKALASYPPPLSFAMAAAQAAAGAVQIGSIASASFGGGGSASAVAPSVAATGATEVSATTPLDEEGGGSRQAATIVNVYPQGHVLTEQELTRQIAAGLDIAKQDGVAA